MTIAEATLGAKVEIPAPTGVISLTIPAGTSSGAKLRVKGQGVKPAGRGPGDLLAEIQIVLPDKMTDEAKELVQKLDEQYQSKPRGDLAW